MKRIAMGVATTALALGGTVAMSTPAQAQPNIGAHNLVNVQISNLLNNNQVSVTVPVNAAANICGVDVAVLAELTDAYTECDARANQDITVSPVN